MNIKWINKGVKRGMKNLMFLSLGQFSSAIVNGLSFLLIIYFLGLPAYGKFVTVSSFVAFFTLLTLNQMSKVIIREGSKDITKMSRIIERTSGIKTALCLLAMLFTFIFTLLSPYTWEIKLYITIFSFHLIYDTYSSFFYSIFNALEKMQYIAILQFGQRVLTFILTVTCLLLGFDILALIVVATLSSLLTVFINYKISSRFIPFRFNLGIYWDKELMKSTLIFSLILFMSFVATRIDVLMLSILASWSDVGVYGAAEKFAEPGQIIRNLAAVAFFPMFVKMFHNKKVKGAILFRYSIAAAFIVFFLITIVVICVNLLSIPLADIVEGTRAEVYLDPIPIWSVLFYYVGISIITIPFINALQATHNEMVVLRISWIPPIANIVLNLVFLKLFGVIGIAYSTLCVYTIGFILHMIVCWKVLKRQGHIY